MKNFGKDIYNDEITLKEADDDQNNLLVEIIDFKNKKITRSREKIRKKILKGRERVIDAFQSKKFPTRNTSTVFSNFDHFKVC